MATQLLRDKTIPELGDNATIVPMFTDPSRQSVDIGAGIHRRAGYERDLVTQPFSDVTTIYENFARSVRLWKDKPLFGYRPLVDGNLQDFEWYTFQQAAEKVYATGSALIHLGFKPDDKVAIYSTNRPEWQFVGQGCAAYSMPTVALYDSLGPDSSKYIVNHAEIKAIATSGECLKKVVEFVSECPSVTHVISFDEVPEPLKEAFAAAAPEVTLLTFSELQKIGTEHRIDPIPPKAQDTAVIMYTSGTTGHPKGVILTHANVVAARAGVQTLLFQIQKDDCYLSFLPLAHILGRVAEEFIIGSGAAIGYWSGNIKKILEDVRVLKPTLMAVVPRVLERIYDGMMEKINEKSALQRFMAKSAIAAKRRALTTVSNTPVWDMLVLSKMKDMLGGRMRGMLSGGAPLRSEIQETLRAAFDIQIMQGYGLTETCAMGVIQIPNSLDVGTPGTVVPCVEIKLVDVPELKYLTTNTPSQGEIWIRGASVASGYYKDEEKTKEAFTEQGWFMTGDIGQWNENGTLVIIDRKKNMFKLAQGEYIAAEALEELYKESPFVSQMFIYGNSYKTQIVSVVVVDPKAIMNYVQSNNIGASSVEEAVKKPELNKAVLEDLKRLCSVKRRAGFERVAAVHLEVKPFEENELVTPSMKLIRKKMEEFYKDDIDRMYAELEKK